MTDVSTLVPSTRDFLQAVATQKKRLVLVPLVDRADDAAALAEAGVTAFAVASPGGPMQAVSDAVGASPILSLAAVASADDALLARASGADAVVLDRVADAARWNSLAKDAFSTRMAALASVVDDASAAFARTTTARGAYLRIETVADLAQIVQKLGSLRTVVHLPSADETTLRTLRGRVDAAIVESDLYLSTSFATLREELDP
jgi:hypothetical protein